MKSRSNIILFLFLIIVSSNVYADDGWIQIKGKVAPALAKVVFVNSDKIAPTIFENDHHAINKCYKIQNGYLTFIESGEGIFEGYELNKHKPGELTDKTLAPINVQVANQAGIYLGMSKQAVEKIIRQALSSTETHISYESVKLIKNMPFDVITSLIIGIDGGRLSRFTVITSITN